MVTDGGLVTIAGFPGAEAVTTKLLDALLSGGSIVSLGNGAPTFHRPNAVLDNTGETIDFASSALQNFHLNGGVIEVGTLITGPGGIINAPGGPDAELANILYNVTVLGGLTLEPGNSLDLFNTTSGGSISGAVTIDSSAYLFINGGVTFENLTLNGGNLERPALQSPASPPKWQ